MLVPVARPALAGAASEVVADFHTALLAIMTAADQLKLNERYQRLAPRVLAIFNIPFMMQAATGRQWSDASEEDRAKLVEAFARMSILSYASRFGTYAGEQFEIVGEHQGLNGSYLVRTRFIRPGVGAVPITYVTKHFGDDWRVVDVIFPGGVSELALRRSEYLYTLRQGGFTSLISRLNQAADAMLQRAQPTDASKR